MKKPWDWMSKLLFLFFLSFIWLPSTHATTFIIEEDGVEVGRWHEDDGVDEVKVVGTNKPSPPPQKVQAPKPLMDEPGYQWEETKMPEGDVATWAVSGRVHDLWNLKAVPNVIVQFHGAGLQYEAKSNYEGYFNLRLPQLQGAVYDIFVKPPQGYDDRIITFKPGGLQKLSYRERLHMGDGISFGNLRIGGNEYDFQIGIPRSQRTKQERADYQRLVLGIGGDTR